MAIIFIIIECFTTQFISIWFALGAIIALLLSCLNFSFFWQLLSFATVGIILTFSLHSIITKRLLKPKALNADGLIGKTAIVEQDFVQGEGRVIVEDMDWKAKSNEKLLKGDSVKIIEINGVTLTVTKQSEDNNQCLYY